MSRRFVLFVGSTFALLCTSSFAGEAKILINHLGYEPGGPKHAVVFGRAGDKISNCSLKNDVDDQQVLTVPPKTAARVEKWRDWYFWTLDFDSFATEGKYYLECSSNEGKVRSFTFLIQRDLLDRNTMSDVIYYFKDERSSGEMDKADRH